MLSLIILYTYIKNYIIMSRLNLGWGLHDYTDLIRSRLPFTIKTIEEYCNIIHLHDKKLTDAIFNSIINEMIDRCGHVIAIDNIKTNYKDGWIIDPDLPGLNIAILLYLTWELVKYGDKDNTRSHTDIFKLMLNEISDTCIQGISHRIYIDFEYLYDVYYKDYINSIQTST